LGVSRVVFAPKLLNDVKTYTFDFSSLLGLGESISTATCTSVVYSGTDPSPSSLINGAAVVNSPLVSQSLTGGTLGVIYEVACIATTTGAALPQTLNITGFLVVLPDLV
jgi:hypothetical protein